jgi:hypothetical protein
MAGCERKLQDRRAGHIGVEDRQRWINNGAVHGRWAATRPSRQSVCFTAFAGTGAGNSVPDTGDAYNLGGIGVYRTLEPNDVFEKKIDISKWFKFTKPDRYEITGIYELELKGKDFGQKVLWDEFATGRCTQLIEK